MCTATEKLYASQQKHATITNSKTLPVTNSSIVTIHSHAYQDRNTNNNKHSHISLCISYTFQLLTF